MVEKKRKRPRDPVQLAKLIGDIATGQKSDTLEDNRDTAAVSLGSRGGSARAKKLSSETRKAIAEKAARSRWKKNP
jgi:hypothetical protein